MPRTFPSGPRRAAALAAVTLTVWVVQPFAAAEAARSTAGLTCTITGTAKADKLKGTSGKDVICGLGGNDTIYGAGGDDVIDGGSGNDTVYGDAGNDTMLGGTGADAMSGGTGTDTVSYADHKSAVSADLDGKADDGSSGEGDKITTTVENIAGGSGADKLTGSSGSNGLAGGKGDDTLNGGAGNDALDGGDGNDTLLGGAGSDNLVGGNGNDTVSYADHTAGVTADLDGARDDGSAGEKDQIAANVENLTGGSGDDKLTGSSANNVLTGGAGNDELTAGNGNDKVAGGPGNDTINGGSGTDTINGESGTNTCDQDSLDTVTNCTVADKTAPAYRGWSLKPSAADTSAAAKDVVAEVRITDELSGVESVTLKLVGPESWTEEASLASGDDKDGQWAAEFTVPAAAPAGNYELWVEAEDKAGNKLASKKTGGVFKQTGDGDSEAPFVKSWGATPLDIDTDQWSEEVTVSAVVTDDISGVDTVTMTLKGPDNTSFSKVATREAGDAQDGTYEAVVEVDEGAPEGTYELFITAKDEAGNSAEKDTGISVDNDY
jgi:Ca2+-binding RTX toxin-like protein